MGVPLLGLFYWYFIKTRSKLDLANERQDAGF